MGYCQYDNSAILGQLFNFLKSTFQLFKIPKLMKFQKINFQEVQNELVQNELAQIEDRGPEIAR